MAIVKVTKNPAEFLCVHKDRIENVELLWAARGLHTYLMSKPDTWEINLTHLIKQAPSGRDALYSFLRELKETGYLRQDRTKDPKTKRFAKTTYLIFETSQKSETENTPEPTPDQGMIENIPSESEYQEESCPVTTKPELTKLDPEKPYRAHPTLVKYNINKNKVNKKPNLGKLTLGLSQQEESSQVGSVDIYKNSFGVEIGSELTPQEETWVEQQFQVLLENPVIKISSPDTLLAEIKFCLCDKAAFTQCEEKLPRKFAAIKTMIETGRWRTPFSMLAKASKIEEGTDSAQQEKLAHIKAQLNEVKAQRNTLQRVQDSDKNYLETFKAITDEAMHRDAEQTAKCQMQKRQEAIIALTADELRLTNELHIFEKRGSNTGVTT